MENAEDEGEREGEEKEQWLAVETTKASGELLFNVHMQREQWRMQKTKRKMKRKEKEKGKRAMVGSEMRERKSFVVLCFCSSHRLLFFFVYYFYKYSCNKQKMLYCEKHAISASIKLHFECI